MDRTKCKSEYIKLLEEDIGVVLHDSGFDNGTCKKAHATKEKIDNLVSSK